MGDSQKLRVSSLNTLPPGVKWLLIGSFISNVGMWMQVMAQGWLVAELSREPFWTGFVGFCSGIPMLLLSLPGGALADRMDRRRLLLISQWMLLGTAAILAFLARTNLVTLFSIALLSLISGTMSAIGLPTYSGFLFDISGKGKISTVISMNAAQLHISRMIGPALAGILFGIVGAWGCFALNSLSFLAVIPLIAIVPANQELGRRKGQSLFFSLGEAFRYVWHERGIRSVLMITGLLAILVMPHMNLLPLYVKEYLGRGPKTLGGMWAASAAGSILATVFFSRISSVSLRGNIRIALGVSVLCAFVLFSLASFANLFLVHLFLFLAGLFLAFINICSQDYLQHIVSPDLRGRVLGIWSTLFQGMFPIGNILVGSLAQVVGIPIAWMIAACLLLLGLLVVSMSRDGNSSPSVLNQ